LRERSHFHQVCFLNHYLLKTMRNQLCTLLLLCTWFVVQATQAQTMRGGLTPEQEKQWREVAEINKMILLRQNPQAHFSKERMATLADAKAKQNEVQQPTSTIASELQVRQRIAAYFQAHPEEGEKYNWGNLPPATPMISALAEMKVSSLDDVKFEALPEQKQMQLIEASPELKAIWQEQQPQMAGMSEAQQSALRKKLWETFKQTKK
jgi:hypothetical protein